MWTNVGSTYEVIEIIIIIIILLTCHKTLPKTIKPKSYLEPKSTQLPHQAQKLTSPTNSGLFQHQYI